MKLLEISSIQHRLVLFLLLPVALLLFSVGFFGFLFARNIILNVWREASILKLERAAHHIDMRLGESLGWIEMFNISGEMMDDFTTQNWILKQLKQIEGVSRVIVEWEDKSPKHMRMPRSGVGMEDSGQMRFHRFHRARISEVTPPQHDTQIGSDIVSFTSYLKDESDKTIGKLEVAIRFDYLMQNIKSLGWWQSDFAGLVDRGGHFLAHTETKLAVHDRLDEMDGPLGLAILEAIQEKPSGTLLGPGHPPEKVGGFYKLTNAPWTIILLAPGKKILKPIIRFRFYYFIAGSLSILFIILLIRFVVGKPARMITEISKAAENVAKGDYGEPIPITSKDEIGQLTDRFNTMVKGLKERDFIRNTFGRYVDQEIAGELMKRPEAAGLGGKKREVAVLMSDLRNFTPLSESLTPEETIRLLNQYFSHMIGIIQRHKGIIVDFFGDALLVFFDPLDESVEPTTKQAVQCAFDMQGKIVDFNAWSIAEGLPELHMGIAVNTGEVVVGNIGSDTRAKYGIVGTPVNITHRIQALAKPGEVVVSGFAYHYVEDEVFVKKAFDAHLKGIRESVKLYVIENRRVPSPIQD